MSNNIEQKSRSRRVVLQLLAMAFFVISIAGLQRLEDATGGGWVFAVVIGAYLGLGFAIGVCLWSGPTSDQANSEMNDELTRHHRALAFKTGFWVAMAMAGLVLAMSVWITDLHVMEAIPPVLGIGVLFAVLRFVSLENAADTDE